MNRRSITDREMPGGSRAATTDKLALRFLLLADTRRARSIDRWQPGLGGVLVAGGQLGWLARKGECCYISDDNRKGREVPREWPAGIRACQSSASGCARTLYEAESRAVASEHAACCLHGGRVGRERRCKQRRIRRRTSPLPVIAIRPDMDPQPDPAAQKGGRGVGWKRQEKGRRLDAAGRMRRRRAGVEIIYLIIRFAWGRVAWDRMGWDGIG